MKLQTKEIAVMTIYAALYAALVVELGGISYGIINFRLADAMVAAVPLLGMAGVLGHTLGVFVSNIPSPLGIIDLLNTIPSFAMSFIVYYVYKKTQNDYTIIATCMAYSVVLGVTVGLMLAPITHIPAPLSIAYVALGNVIATVGIGWPMFKLLKRTGVLQRWFETTKVTSQKE